MHTVVMKSVASSLLCIYLSLGAAQEERSRASHAVLATEEAKEINAQLHRAAFSGDCETVLGLLLAGASIDAV